MKEKEIFEFIDDNIASTQIKGREIDAKYHHNTTYEQAPSIIKYGILSIEDLHKKGIMTLSAEALKRISNIESHVNGTDGISLARTGLTDLYGDEEEYDPLRPAVVDFIIDSNIKACRSTIHYGNEYIANSPIEPSKIQSVDIRIRKYLKLLEKKDVETAIKYYENLKLIAQALKEKQLDIPLRELSEKNTSLDIDKVLKMPKIKRG